MTCCSQSRGVLGIRRVVTDDSCHLKIERHCTICFDDKLNNLLSVYHGSGSHYTAIVMLACTLALSVYNLRLQAHA